MLQRNFILKIVFITGISMLIPGCGIFDSSDHDIIDKLLSAPEKIVIEGGEFVLETFLWRDFMPICPPDGKPLTALIRVIASDSLPFPFSVDADRLWVIKDKKEIWETEFSDGEIPQSLHQKHQLLKIARNGPKWGPYIYVDVVVRIVDNVNDNTFLLLAPDQWIDRTD